MPIREKFRPVKSEVKIEEITTDNKVLGQSWTWKDFAAPEVEEGSPAHKLLMDLINSGLQRDEVKHYYELASTGEFWHNGIAVRFWNAIINRVADAYTEHAKSKATGKTNNDKCGGLIKWKINKYLTEHPPITTDKTISRNGQET